MNKVIQENIIYKDYTNNKFLSYKIANILFILFITRILFLRKGMDQPGLNIFVIIQLSAVTMLFIIAIMQNDVPIIKTLQNKAIVLGLSLYALGMFSAFWSVIPLLSFSLAMQNFFFIVILFYFVGSKKDFLATEKYLLALLVLLAVFSLLSNAISRGSIPSIAYFLNLHDLNAGAIGGALFSYCFSERLIINPDVYPWQGSLHPQIYSNRKILLSAGCVFGFITLLVATSGGANVSVLVALLAFILARRSIFLFFVLTMLLFTLNAFPNLIWIAVDSIFPGKSIANITSVGCRTMLWEQILALFSEKPILGWGYGTIERLGDLYADDSHNSFLGILGGLGLIGVTIFILFIVTLLYRLYRKSRQVGYTGLFCATVCLAANSNTFGFLSGKTFVMTIAFFAFLSCSYWYQERFSTYTESDYCGTFCEKQSYRTNPSLYFEIAQRYV